MNTFDAINQRRAVKAFDPSHRFTAAEETTLFEAAIQSPTSFNMQNWRFVVVRNPELRKQIRAAMVDQAQVTDASLLIVLTADLKAWKKSPERYWRNASPEIQKLVTGWMGRPCDRLHDRRRQGCEARHAEGQPAGPVGGGGAGSVCVTDRTAPAAAAARPLDREVY